MCSTFLICLLTHQSIPRPHPWPASRLVSWYENLATLFRLGVFVHILFIWVYNMDIHDFLSFFSPPQSGFHILHSSKSTLIKNVNETSRDKSSLHLTWPYLTATFEPLALFLLLEALSFTWSLGHLSQLSSPPLVAPFQSLCLDTSHLLDVYKL